MGSQGARVTPPKVWEFVEPINIWLERAEALFPHSSQVPFSATDPGLYVTVPME